MGCGWYPELTKVIKSSTARRDLRHVGRYIAKESGNRHVAVSFLQRLDEHFALIATQPRMGRIRDDLQPGLRCQPFDSYLILYRPKGDGIEIARLLHAARDVESLFH